MLKPKPELKLKVNEFIQILADLPELKVEKQSSLKIMPTPKPKPKLKQKVFSFYHYSPKIKEKVILSHSSEIINI